jgi:tetratricopeptide (TPR) repeat protein
MLTFFRVPGFSRVLSAVRQHPGLALLVLALLVVLGAASTLIARQVRAELYLQSAEQHLELADHFHRQTHLDLARDNLTRCLEVWPQSGKIHFLLARVERRSGAGLEAARELQLAEKLGWVTEAIELERALQQAQKGDLHPVEKALHVIIEEGHPERTLVLEALSQGYLENYQLTWARDCLNQWLEIQPDNTQALSWRGQVHVLLGRSNDALRDYRRVVQLDNDADDARARLADLLLGSHEVTVALTHFERLQGKKPDDPEVLLGLARCQVELGQTDEAIQTLDRLLAIDPNHVLGLAERGRLALELNQPAEAERWLRRSLALAPFERETLYSMYRCLEFQKRPDEAKVFHETMERIDADRKRLDELRLAIMATPHDASLRCEMGQILLRNAQTKEGCRWLESALKEDPHDENAHTALAEFYEGSGDPRQAALHRRHASQVPAIPSSK